MKKQTMLVGGLILISSVSDLVYKKYKYEKAKKETKKRAEEKELERLNKRFEEIKRDIEEGEKNDPFRKEIERLVNATNRLV